MRDCVTAEDIGDLVLRQIRANGSDEKPRVANVGGGLEGSMSLLEMTRLCESCMGREIKVEASREVRPYDIPYYVTDTSRAEAVWAWKPSMTAEEIVAALCKWTLDNMDFVEGLFK